MLKLKKKLNFRGHVYFETVRPEFLEAALTWLKNNNKLYKDITIECANINPKFTDLQQTEIEGILDSPQNSVYEDHSTLYSEQTSDNISGKSNCSMLQGSELSRKFAKVNVVSRIF